MAAELSPAGNARKQTPQGPLPCGLASHCPLPCRLNIGSSDTTHPANDPIANATRQKNGINKKAMTAVDDIRPPGAYSGYQTLTWPSSVSPKTATNPPQKMQFSRAPLTLKDRTHVKTMRAAKGMNANNMRRNRLCPSANWRRRMSSADLNGEIRPTKTSRTKMVIEGRRIPVTRGTNK